MFKVTEPVEVLSARDERVEVHAIRTRQNLDDSIKEVRDLMVINDDLVVPGLFVENDFAAPSVRAPQHFSHASLASIVRL